VVSHRSGVPTDIKATYGKREDLISLRTRDYQEALRKVRIKAVEIDNRFEEHRRQIRRANRQFGSDRYSVWHRFLGIGFWFWELLPFRTWFNSAASRRSI